MTCRCIRSGYWWVLIPAQRERLERIAHRVGRSTKAVMRDAIDAYTLPCARSRHEALRSLTGLAAPIDHWDRMEGEIAREAAGGREYPISPTRTPRIENQRWRRPLIRCESHVVGPPTRSLRWIEAWWNGRSRATGMPTRRSCASRPIACTPSLTASRGTWTSPMRPYSGRSWRCGGSCPASAIRIGSRRGPTDSLSASRSPSRVEPGGRASGRSGWTNQ